MELAITTHPSAERYLIVVEGEIDISNADKLRNAIDLALEQPTERVELDFSQVPYIDSTGIGVLVGAARRASERERALSITGAQPNVLRVAQLLGIDKDISISASYGFIRTATRRGAWRTAALYLEYCRFGRRTERRMDI